jgi:hypothetical protein
VLTIKRKSLRTIDPVKGVRAGGEASLEELAEPLDSPIGEVRRWLRITKEGIDPGEDTETCSGPSRPGEFHPEPLTEPDLILSHQPARATH